MPSRAGFWIRAVAALIDLIALMLILIGAGMMALALLERTPGPITAEAEDRVLDPLLYGLMLAYTSLEIWAAATPGKMIFRLRITEQDGRPAEFWRRVLRWSTKWLWLALSLLFVLSEWGPLYWLSGLTSLIVLVGCFFASNDDRLAWHDQWAHTAVCHVPRAYRSFDVVMPPPLPPSAPSP